MVRSYVEPRKRKYQGWLSIVGYCIRYNNNNNNNNKLQEEQMVEKTSREWVKCLLCKPEGLNPNPQHLCKSQVWLCS